MHPRVEKLPQPSPDYRRFLGVLQREKPFRVPLIELAVHPTVIGALLDQPFSDDEITDACLVARRTAAVMHRLGYDVVKVSAPIPWDIGRLSATASSGIAWADEHRGPIATLDDLDAFRWPRVEDVDFSPVDATLDVLPDGMAVIGFSGGILEFSMDLLGMQNFLIATRRNPELVRRIVDHVGEVVVGVFEAYCQIDRVCAVWLGDDLGHKHGLLVSPKFLKETIVPWYRRLAEVAHRYGRPFLFHTCGNTADILPTLVDDVGIDAKHSFEDGIEPVERFYDRWANRIAVMGGVDVHILATADEATVRQRMRQILEHVALRGGYVAGSGNSIPNYVPPENYLAMVEAVAEFNQ